MTLHHELFLHQLALARVAMQPDRAVVAMTHAVASDAKPRRTLVDFIQAAERLKSLPRPPAEWEMTRSEFERLKAVCPAGYPTDPLTPHPRQFMGLRICIKEPSP